VTPPPPAHTAPLHVAAVSTCPGVASGEDGTAQPTSLRQATQDDFRDKSFSAAQNRDHGVTEARRILALAEQEFGLTDWSSLKKGDWRKGLVAGIIRKSSLVANSWLAEQLDMGVPNAVSRTIRLARERTKDNRKMRQLAGRLERRIGGE
jgi:hypothetical protein